MTYSPPLQGDQREPHNSGRPVSPAYLEKLGVIYQHVPDVSGVDSIAASRQYKNRDEVTISPDSLGAVYEEKVKTFFSEHLHEDEEIRYILDGAGYFDVRGEHDDWVRIWLEKGDLIILPSGIYHRFTTDERNVSLWICGITLFYFVFVFVFFRFCFCFCFLAFFLIIIFFFFFGQVRWTNANDIYTTVYKGYAPFQGRAQMDTAKQER